MSLQGVYPVSFSVFCLLILAISSFNCASATAAAVRFASCIPICFTRLLSGFFKSIIICLMASVGEVNQERYVDNASIDVPESQSASPNLVTALTTSHFCHSFLATSHFATHSKSLLHCLSIAFLASFVCDLNTSIAVLAWFLLMTLFS